MSISELLIFLTSLQPYDELYIDYNKGLIEVYRWHSEQWEEDEDQDEDVDFYCGRMHYYYNHVATIELMYESWDEHDLECEDNITEIEDAYGEQLPTVYCIDMVGTLLHFKPRDWVKVDVTMLAVYRWVVPDSNCNDYFQHCNIMRNLHGKLEEINVVNQP